MTRAAYHLNNFVTEFASDEGRFVAYAAVAGSSRRKILTEVRRQFKSLPPDEFPTLVTLADHLTEDAQDDLFQFGIDMCLRGIQSLATREARESRSPRSPAVGARRVQLHKHERTILFKDRNTSAASASVDAEYGKRLRKRLTLTFAIIED